MITKTYKSVYNPYVISLRISDKLVRIKFTGEYKTNRQGNLASFVTSDETVQKAIESFRSFGEKGKAAIWLADVVETKEPEVPVAVKEPEVPVDTNQGTTNAYADVTTYEEAKAIMMAEPYNCKVQAVNTLERLLARAAKEGVSFPAISQ